MILTINITYLSIKSINKSGENITVSEIFPETNNIDINFLFFEFFGQFNQLFLFGGHRAANKSNNSHLMVFALTVFQSQLEKVI